MPWPLLLSLLAVHCPGYPSYRMQEPSVRAPELTGSEWLNTDRPLSLAEDLAGHVVLLDFWTYCCINCMHVLPELAALEEEFRDEPFAVVGVHSAKFEQEGDAANVRQAILRYGIRHPVVVDTGMRIWRAYSVRAWPTLVLVDPVGRYAGSVSGEGNLELLRKNIRALLERHRSRGELAREPFRPVLEKAPRAALRFPGKVLADGARLFVSDSSGNRVLEADAGSGRILRSFGSGLPGFADGGPEEARLHNPQGLARLGDALYVADTGNHALRRVDLGSGEVSTVAGTGEQARPLPRPGKAGGTPLNSPWALEAEGSLLHVAMAGSHQLWSFDPGSGELRPLAGSGRENLLDGPAGRAALAQPSGLALAGRRLYFADSEVSALRFVDLERGEVRTLVGTGLFDFGDRDGTRDARLQHPLGAAVWRDKVLIADTYNNKIKLLDPESGTCSTLFGTGAPEAAGEELALYEPGGLDVSGETLFVADTNHHRVVAVDLETGAWRVVLGGGRPAPPAATPSGD